MKRSILGATFILTMPFLAYAGPGSKILPSIRVVGPNAEVIEYERKDGEVIIRQCEKFTGGNQVGKNGGCVVTSEVKYSEKDFKALLEARLQNLAKDHLSKEQKKLLENALVNPSPSIEEDKKKLAKLEAELKKAEDFNAEEPSDGDSEAVKKLKAEKDCVDCRLKAQDEIIKAKAEIATLLKTLMEQMDGNEIKRVERHSKNGGEIAFNLLKEIAAVETKTISKGALFVRVERANFGKAFKDPSGMIWSEKVSTSNQYDAEKKCKEIGGTLPTKEDFERLRSYLDTGTDGLLTDKGRTELYAIFPDMKDNWFWSSSVYPYNTDYAYVFNGNVGVIVSFNRYGDNGSVRCVGR